MSSSREKLVLNQFCFMFNSLAMGDVIAAAPVVKWAIENYYPDHKNYLVVAKGMFRPLFPFVPDENFRDYDVRENSWGVPLNYAMACLNQKKEPMIVRNTPKHMHLSQFASIKLMDRILSDKYLRYVPLTPVSIESFNLPKKYVVFVSSYRDDTRAWHADYILETAKWVSTVGYCPVFIGKTDMKLETHLIPKSSLPPVIEGLEHIDLRNKTSIPELAMIMSNAKAVVGLDSGPIHLAGTTSVPIVCGFTSILPEYRIPFRKKGVFLSVTPNIPCIGCESNWSSHFHNFENCYLGHIDCCKQMTSEKFISKLKSILK